MERGSSPLLPVIAVLCMVAALIFFLPNATACAAVQELFSC